MKFKNILESNSADFKELKNDLKNKSFEDVYNKLIDMLQSKDYSDSVDFIDTIVKDPKLKFILSLGFGGEYADIELSLKKVNLPVYKLIPTQSEIGTNETLKYICKDGKNIDKCFEPYVIIKSPIVTFQNTFIIDGHHRWSEIYATNSNANVVCINIDGNLSPINMLKAVQATIGSNLGTLITKDVEGKNIFNISNDKIKKYLEDNMSSKSLELLKKYYNDPIKQIYKNCIMLKNNNHCILNAPKRGEMPQTSKDPDLFKDLNKGVTKI